MSKNKKADENKTLSSVSKVMQRAMQHRQKYIDQLITPSTRLQQQLERITFSIDQTKKLTFPIDQISKTIEAQERFRNWMFLPEQLEKFQHQAQIANNVSERLQIFASTRQLQASWSLPKHIQNAIQGLALDSRLVDSLKQFNTISNRFAEIQQSLATESIFLGEYDLPNADEYNDDEISSGLLLPEPIHEPLKKVNFLPITVIRKIYDDPTLLRAIDPRDFEYFVADLIDKLGFENVQVTSRSGDGGRDIYATRIVEGIPLLFAFECKRYAPKNKIKPGIMRALLGTISANETKANMGVLVTTSTFSRKARDFIAAEHQLDGKDFSDLVNWINQVKR